MSIHIERNYAKKIGLPGYSSHQYSVTIRTELTDLSQLEKTNAELYARLQMAVDSQIVNAGQQQSGGQHRRTRRRQRQPRRRQQQRRLGLFAETAGADPQDRG